MIGRWWFFLKYIWPPSVVAGVLSLLGEWQRTGAKNRVILSVLFIPTIVCVGGLVFCIGRFVLLYLPSFILSVFGWLLLISLFSGAGLFCYQKINAKGPTRNSTSYEYDVNLGEDKKDWFNEDKWFKK